MCVCENTRTSSVHTVGSATFSTQIWYSAAAEDRATWRHHQEELCEERKRGKCNKSREGNHGHGKCVKCNHKVSWSVHTYREILPVAILFLDLILCLLTLFPLHSESPADKSSTVVTSQAIQQRTRGNTSKLNNSLSSPKMFYNRL